ncbi:MAG: tRNA epoxyqueuosine(34) reductase QueG [Planctomycetota bacterium]
MAPRELSNLVKSLALDLGFERCGIATAGPIPHDAYFIDWLKQDRAGTMGYLHRHMESRIDLRAWVPSTQSVIVVAMNYTQPEPTPSDQVPRGRVAMYAWGEDYHVVIRERLEQLVARLRELVDEPFEARVCVDTSAIIERELAAMAGVGWIGKNTLVMHQSVGSYFFLGEVLVDLDLSPDVPEPDHCGSCTRCLDACPTQAFPAPYEMDARRCISYLTIEHRGEIEPDLAPNMGDWIFGCDICQQVCPHNRDAPSTKEPRFLASIETARPALHEVLGWDDAQCAKHVEGHATNRAKPMMWKRNAAIALHNITKTDG